MSIAAPAVNSAQGLAPAGGANAQSPRAEAEGIDIEPHQFTGLLGRSERHCERRPLSGGPAAIRFRMTEAFKELDFGNGGGVDAAA
jgi:hypothetical protein